MKATGKRKGKKSKLILKLKGKCRERKKQKGKVTSQKKIRKSRKK